MFNSKNEKAYEKKLREIKKDHFERIDDLMEENIQLKNKIRELELEYENQILALKQQIKLEKENIKITKEKSLLETDREILGKKAKFQDEKTKALENKFNNERQVLREVASIALSGKSRELNVNIIDKDKKSFSIENKEDENGVSS